MKTKQISSRWVQEGSFLLHMHITYRCSPAKVSILQFAVHFETREYWKKLLKINREHQLLSATI